MKILTDTQKVGHASLSYHRHALSLQFVKSFWFYIFNPFLYLQVFICSIDKHIKSYYFSIQYF